MGEERSTEREAAPSGEHAPCGWRLIEADARALPLDDETVDLVVTSPPYWKQRDYEFDWQIGHEQTRHEYLTALWDATAEAMRVLKPSGSMFVNLGDKRLSNGSKGLLPQAYALGCEERGWIVRSEILWSKPRSLDTKATDRVMDTHEHWWHLVKQRPYYANLDGIRVPYAAHTLYTKQLQDGGYNRPRGNPNRSDGGHPKVNPHPLGRIPGSVWDVATEKVKRPDHLDVEHFAPFPREWPRRFIAAWCPPGGVVLDPFVGSGSTVLAAVESDRHGIGVDGSADYLRLAEWRLTEREGGQGRLEPNDTIAKLNGRKR